LGEHSLQTGEEEDERGEWPKERGERGERGTKGRTNRKDKRDRGMIRENGMAKSTILREPERKQEREKRPRAKMERR